MCFLCVACDGSVKGRFGACGSKWKIQGRNFKICALYFKICPTFFSGGSFGGVLNADKHVASARLLMSVPVCLVFSSVLFFVVRRPGCVFSCFPVIFFACVYVFVFQGCAVREASVLCGSGIKSLKKVMEKFGCLVWRLYFSWLRQCATQIKICCQICRKVVSLRGASPSRRVS